MKKENSKISTKETSPEVAAVVKTAKHLKNPILTEADLQRFASSFTSRGVANKRFNSGIVKFSRVYSLNKPWMKYTLAIVLGLVMSIFTVLLVEVTGLYAGGFSACFQGVARLVYAAMMKHAGGAGATATAAYTAQVVYNALFWGLYVCLNVPLTIFAYRKINKSFAKLSIVYLIVLQGMGFIWGIIPGIHDIQIFGDTSTVDSVLNSYHIQSIQFSPPADVTENITRAFLLLVYSIIFSLVSALCYTLMFIIGGSTAGSDYLTIFWSQEKNKNVGSIFIIITSVSMLMGIAMGTYGAGALIDSSKYAG
ncbi:hypothetical protein FACS1894166_04330 [Bacilli bacterium]|nr:hypothetical protein FACS1894166_04330 [Bacilli bacterium]